MGRLGTPEEVAGTHVGGDDRLRDGDDGRDGERDGDDGRDGERDDGEAREAEGQVVRRLKRPG
jgi:hypothetical protein